MTEHMKELELEIIETCKTNEAEASFEHENKNGEFMVCSYGPVPCVYQSDQKRLEQNQVPLYECLYEQMWGLRI